MNNQEIVELLRNMAAALTLSSENRFRITAYEKAADSIEHLTSEVKDLWNDGKLDTIPGIGEALASHLDELFRTGKVRLFETTFKSLSPAFFEFLKIPGLGPKRAFQLSKELNIKNPKTSIKSLENAAILGKIAHLAGWGEKSQAELLVAIKVYKRGQIKENRMSLPFADALAREVIDYIRLNSEIIRIDVLGSLRRKLASIGDIDIAVATNKPKLVIETFVKYPKIRKIIDQGEKGATVLLSVGRKVDLRVQKPESYGAMLQYFTGNKQHNIRLREYALKRGLSLSEYGIKRLQKSYSFHFIACSYNKKKNLYEFETEKAFYEALGMDWIPPELREGSGEIEASLSHKLPTLIKDQDLLGDLHIHSDYDLKPSHDLGSSSLNEILDHASKFKYDYIGISDHNPSFTNQNENQIISIMKKRREKFEQIYSSWTNSVKNSATSPGNRIHLFIMLEVDIDPKGKLALPEKAFADVDAVIVSVHSAFNQSKDLMTQRILNGLEHPKAKILGHPTGRLLDRREGVEADWAKIFGYCAKNQKALEINSCSDRLDLPDRLVKEAIDSGVKLIINTDSHAVDQIKNIKYGVDVARRGWAEKKDILNTLGYNEFSKWLKSD